MIEHLPYTSKSLLNMQKILYKFAEEISFLFVLLFCTFRNNFARTFLFFSKRSPSICTDFTQFAALCFICSIQVRNIADCVASMLLTHVACCRGTAAQAATEVAAAGAEIKTVAAMLAKGD